MRTSFSSFLAIGLAFAVGGWCGQARGQYGYGTEYHSSTAGEGYARGLGSVISAKGDYNLSTSQAAINMTQAQRNEIENRQAATQAYFEMRKMNRAYRAAEKMPRASMEDLVRYAQAGKPKPLSPGEFDAVAGKIAWPRLLQTSQYDNQRKELEQLFAKRSSYGGVRYEEELKIREITNSLLASLKDNMKQLPPADYVAAKRFVESLAYEGSKRVG